MPIHSASTEQSLVSSDARTAADSSGWVDVSRYAQVSFFVEVTAVSGTNPQLVIWAEESPDQSTAYPILPTEVITAAVNRRIPVTVFGRWLRIRWAAIEGTATPTVTFAVTYIGKD